MTFFVLSLQQELLTKQARNTYATNKQKFMWNDVCICVVGRKILVLSSVIVKMKTKKIYN